MQKTAKDFKSLKDNQKKVFGCIFDQSKNLKDFLKENLENKIKTSSIKEGTPIKLIIDGSSAKSLNIYFSQFGIPAYSENIAGFKNFGEKLLECLKEAVESFDSHKFTYKAVAFFEGAVEWDQKNHEEADSGKKVSEFKNTTFTLAIDDKLKKPPKSLRREMCIRGFQLAGIETLHADSEVELKLVQEAKENCIGVVSGETEYLFFDLDSIVPFLSISFDDDNVLCTPIELKTILETLKMTPAQFKAVGNILAFGTNPPRYKFIWGNNDVQEAAIEFVQKHMKSDEDCLKFMNRLSEIVLEESELKHFSNVGSNVKSFCGDKPEKADIFNLNNILHNSNYISHVFNKLSGYYPEAVQELSSKENSFLDQFHKAEISNRCFELLLNKHFWWPTILQNEELPQPFAESLAIRRRLYTFLFGHLETIHEEIRVYDVKEDVGSVYFKNETTQSNADFKGKNFFNSWNLQDWRSRVTILAQILLTPDDFASDITQKLINEKSLDLDQVVFALMFKAVCSSFSFPSWDKETCVKKMLSHSLFCFSNKSPQEYKAYVTNLFSYLKISYSEINVLPNRAVDRRHNPFQTNVTKDEQNLMIFSFSRLETIVYHVLFAASFLNLPTLFCSEKSSCGIPLVGFNAKINIQFKPNKSMTNSTPRSSQSSSSPYQSKSSSSSSSSSSQQGGQKKPAIASSSQGGQKGGYSSQGGQKKQQKQQEEEVDEDGFTVVSHKPKNTKPQQGSGWWSGPQGQKKK